MQFCAQRLGKSVAIEWMERKVARAAEFSAPAANTRTVDACDELLAGLRRLMVRAADVRVLFAVSALRKYRASGGCVCLSRRLCAAFVVIVLASSVLIAATFPPAPIEEP